MMHLGLGKHRQRPSMRAAAASPACSWLRAHPRRSPCCTPRAESSNAPSNPNRGFPLRHQRQQQQQLQRQPPADVRNRQPPASPNPSGAADFPTAGSSAGANAAAPPAPPMGKAAPAVGSCQPGTRPLRIRFPSRLIWSTRFPWSSRRSGCSSCWRGWRCATPSIPR